MAAWRPHAKCSRTPQIAQRTIDAGVIPDFGVKIFNVLLVDFRGFPAAPLEHARRALKQCPIPLMDHRRMNPKPTSQLADRRLALKRLQCHFRLKLWVRSCQNKSA